MNIYINVTFWGYYISLDNQNKEGKKELFTETRQQQSKLFFSYVSEHDVNQVFQVKRNRALYINLECGLFW